MQLRNYNTKKREREITQEITKEKELNDEMKKKNIGWILFVYISSY
jgi:hypothetical protein